LNFENSDTQIGDTTQNGYQIILDDTEEKYRYFALRAAETNEIPRNELIEMIKSGKPMPVIEIKEKVYAVSQ